MLRVLVVENEGDRRLADAIAEAPRTELAGVAATGKQAISLAQRMAPDAIVISSTVLAVNAFDATREIMTVAPAPVIVVIDETGAGADNVRARAHEAGALAAVPFPQRPGDLIETVCTMAAVGVVRRRPERPSNGRAHHEPTRTPARVTPATVVAIGASTGGPAALRSIFAALPANLAAPILVTQHIAAGFSEGMVFWWNAAGPLPVKLAEAGEPLVNGTIYVAPDDHHLTLSADSTIRLSNAPPDGGHRPSVNVMFRSVAERFGTGTFAVILTGMGRDGVEGLRDVHRLGGTVCAQDEASSAVFGMPKAAIDAGVVDLVSPLTMIPRRIVDAVPSS